MSIRAASYMGIGSSGYHHLAVIMVLIAYFFVGGIGGFESNGSGHPPQETLHLPSTIRDGGPATTLRLADTVSGEDDTHLQAPQAFQYIVDRTSAVASPPPVTRESAISVTVDDFAHLAGLILNLLAGMDQPAPQFPVAQAFAPPNLDRWLRTVVLHL